MRGLIDPADHMKIALGRHHLETLTAMANLIIALGSQGLYDRAEVVGEECLILCGEAQGVSNLSFNYLC
jgi:hypothetical protein